ncbi:MAG: hypothetical protein M0001_09730 [Treponema sp.]|nr:hypothetical protein [Treponema sp.]
MAVLLARLRTRKVPKEHDGAGEPVEPTDDHSTRGDPTEGFAEARIVTKGTVSDAPF